MHPQEAFPFPRSGGEGDAASFLCCNQEWGPDALLVRPGRVAELGSASAAARALSAFHPVAGFFHH